MRTIIQPFPYMVGYSNALKSLGHEALIWDGRPIFDWFAQLKPDIFFCNSDLTPGMVRCIDKYRPKVFCFLTERINRDVIPYVSRFYTDNKLLRVDFGEVVYAPPAFDSIRYRRVDPFEGFTYVGNFNPNLHWVLRAIQDTNLRILGLNWPSRSVGTFLDQTEMKALSGHILSFGGLEELYKVIGCGGIPLFKQSELPVDPLYMFSSYEEMLTKMGSKLKPPRLEVPTYIERVKNVCGI